MLTNDLHEQFVVGSEWFIDDSENPYTLEKNTGRHVTFYNEINESVAYFYIKDSPYYDVTEIEINSKGEIEIYNTESFSCDHRGRITVRELYKTLRKK